MTLLISINDQWFGGDLGIAKRDSKRQQASEMESVYSSKHFFSGGSASRGLLEDGEVTGEEASLCAQVESRRLKVEGQMKFWEMERFRWGPRIDGDGLSKDSRIASVPRNDLRRKQQRVFFVLAVALWLASTYRVRVPYCPLWVEQRP